MSNVPLPESVEFWGDIPVKTKSMLAMKTLASGIKGSEKSTTILAISPVPSAANDIIVQACIQVVVKVKNNRTSYTIPLVLVHTTTVTHDHCDGSAAAARLRRVGDSGVQSLLVVKSHVWLRCQRFSGYFRRKTSYTPPSQFYSIKYYIKSRFKNNAETRLSKS